MDPVRQIAAAVLYEGYLLWPYRRTALKNRQRWTFGAVLPRAWVESGHPDDTWTMETRCLVEGDGRARVDVEVRFLQVVDRRVARVTAAGPEFVDALTVGDTSHLTWEEATERTAGVSGLSLAALQAPRRTSIEVCAGGETEWLLHPGGTRAGAVVRRWEALDGALEVQAEPLGQGLFRLTARVVNLTPWDGRDRGEALRRALVSTHTTLRVAGGAFVSLMDPPPALRAAAEACRNVGTWPVLVGEDGARDTMLSSPIILYDYPRVAPESPGDLFDATEIDQLLVLNVLGLTDAERQEMRGSDPRARAILDRCEALGPGELERLHGAVREVGALAAGPQPPVSPATRPRSTDTEAPGGAAGSTAPPERLSDDA